MNYEEFFAKAKNNGLALPDVPSSEMTYTSLNNEALFQLPLLAMTILMLSKGRSKPATQELGQLVGECLERTVKGFKGSSQGIGWSANLRIRTIKALAFLERTGLASVDSHDNYVKITEHGRRIINKVTEEDSPLCNALLTIERSFENIREERKILEKV